MDPTIRLRIANRIHFALLRHYGEDVDVATLLLGRAEAREALWVCEASGQTELVQLARQFSAATAQAAVPAAAAPQDMNWSQDTSGFGVSRLEEPAVEAPDGRPAHWRRAARWLRGSQQA